MKIELTERELELIIKALIFYNEEAFMVNPYETKRLKEQLIQIQQFPKP